MLVMFNGAVIDFCKHLLSSLVMEEWLGWVRIVLAKMVVYEAHSVRRGENGLFGEEHSCQMWFERQIGIMSFGSLKARIK